LTKTLDYVKHISTTLLLLQNSFENVFLILCIRQFPF